jgi:pimeloyl-ACP methyl ester carboxylesterase
MIGHTSERLFEVNILDPTGGRSRMLVRAPRHCDKNTGVIVMLHGARATPESVSNFFETTAERLGMAILYPEANVLHGSDAQQDWFARPDQETARWSYSSSNPTFSGMKWAVDNLNVDPRRCFLAGVSMGGFAAWNLAIRFADQFAGVIPISGGLSRWEFLGNDDEARYLVDNALAVPIYAVHSAEDRIVPPRFDRWTVERLRFLGHANLEYEELPGEDHYISLDSGSGLIDKIEAWIGDRKRVVPDRIRHRATADSHGRNHWVQISGIACKRAEIRAIRTGQTEYELEIIGASKISIFPDTNEDISDRINVCVNGQVTKFTEAKDTFEGCTKLQTTLGHREYRCVIDI